MSEVAKSKELNIIDILCYDVGSGILKYLLPKDLTNLREVCTQIYSMLFQKGFFNLRIISATFQSIKPVLNNTNFVLYLMKKNWNMVSKRSFRQLNQWGVYKKFVEHTIEKQKALLSENIQKKLQGRYPSLVVSYEAFASEVAFSAHQKGGNTVLREELIGETTSEWINLKKTIEQDLLKEYDAQVERSKEKSAEHQLNKENFVLRIKRCMEQFESELPLKTYGQEGASQIYEFSHKSLFEYFMAKKLIMLKDSDAIIEEGSRLLMYRPVQTEKGALRFWEEGWRDEDNHLLKDAFFEIIKVSRYE